MTHGVRPADADPHEGEVAADLLAEFPDLSILTLAAQVGEGSSPRELRRRLKDLSDRFRGAHAITMRSDPIPHAYRVFFRHVGLDPDSDRPPLEAAALSRLLLGGWRSRGDRVADATTLALLETKIPVWALRTGDVTGSLTLRTAAVPEPLGPDADAWAPAGRIVVADGRRALAEVFRDVPGALVPGRGEPAVLFAVRVPGVPRIHVEEALWIAAEALAA